MTRAGPISAERLRAYPPSDQERRWDLLRLYAGDLERARKAEAWICDAEAELDEHFASETGSATVVAAGCNGGAGFEPADPLRSHPAPGALDRSATPPLHSDYSTLRAGLDTGSDHLLTAHQEDRGCPDLCGRISNPPLERVLSTPPQPDPCTTDAATTQDAAGRTEPRAIPDFLRRKTGEGNGVPSAARPDRGRSEAGEGTR